MSHSRKNSSSHEHVMLLFEDYAQRMTSAVDYMNEGLQCGNLVIYASVFAADPTHLTDIASRIRNYSDNIAKGNFLVLDLESFYQRALTGDLEPFMDLKVVLEEAILERINAGKSDKVLILADCAENLSQNEKFDECVIVERWWRDTHAEWLKDNAKITIICPHPSSTLDKDHFARQKQRISDQHTLTVRILAN